MQERKKTIQFLMCIILISSFLYPYFDNSSNNNLEDNNRNPIASRQVTETKQWLDNPTFESPVEPTWFWTNGTEGDNSDLNAFTNTNQANYGVMGENRSFTVVSGTINNSINSQGWKQFDNEGFLQPDTAEIRSYGCYVYHRWQDDANQFPSVHWKKNISVPVDMSSYLITSASLEVIFNASANANVDTPNDDGSWEFFANGDSATFYVQISDLGYNPPLYTVAYNKTKYLGQQNFSQPTILTISDSPLGVASEIDLIAALNSAFEKDPTHSNITITLGIDIYCEDNVQTSDDDIFDALIIKSCELSFNCTKRIDHSTSLSWCQIADELDPQTTEIVDANFNFEYKIDSPWPTIAPLSEIRFFINDRLYEAGTIKLINANATFQEAASGGFDVTGFIEMGVNISVSIQVYLKDSFLFDENINISITNVFFNISYTLTLPDYDTELQLFLNNEEKTSSPILEVPIGELINITTKFTNVSTGQHINGAVISLQGDRVLRNLTENVIGQSYYTILNSSSDLNMGNNFLTIETQYVDHQTQIINPIITVRKINTEIVLISGTSAINVKPGEDITLEILLNNTDYDEAVSGAIVTYSWELGQGEFADDNDDGIYNLSISNIPAGSYNILITAFSGDDYSFETFEITITASKPSNPLWTLLLYVLIGGIIGVVSIFTIYQTHLKYPPLIRKIRKLRKKFRKGKKTKPIVLSSRKEIISIRMKETQNVLNLEMDSKLEKSTETEIVEKAQETSNNKGGIQK